MFHFDFRIQQEAVVTDESDPPLLKRNVRVVRVNSFSKAAANQSTAKAEPAAGTNQQQKILSPKKPLANTMVRATMGSMIDCLKRPLIF